MRFKLEWIVNRFGWLVQRSATFTARINRKRAKVNVATTQTPLVNLELATITATKQIPSQTSLGIHFFNEERNTFEARSVVSNLAN